ncbi:hypothetical protein ABWH91_14110 [Phycisphaerales bacterium ac7]
MFATDRDLWILEPRLFDDIAFSAQARLTNQPATVGAGSLALNFTGIDLTALGLVPGMVIALDGYGRFEITEVTSATALGVSRCAMRTMRPPFRSRSRRAPRSAPQS